MPILFNINII